MPITVDKELPFEPQYKKARIRHSGPIAHSTSISSPNQQSLVTSCIDGTIQVIIVNKGQQEQDVDKSTSL